MLPCDSAAGTDAGTAVAASTTGVAARGGLAGGGGVGVTRASVIGVGAGVWIGGAALRARNTVAPAPPTASAATTPAATAAGQARFRREPCPSRLRIADRTSEAGTSRACAL